MGTAWIRQRRSEIGKSAKLSGTPRSRGQHRVEERTYFRGAAKDSGGRPVLGTGRTGHSPHAGIHAARSGARQRPDRRLAADPAEVLPRNLGEESLRPHGARDFDTLYGGRSNASRPSPILDALIQRVKSLEAQVSGLAWTSAQRLELLPSDAATLSSCQEIRLATTEQRAEPQAHQGGGWRTRGAGKKVRKETSARKGKGEKGKDKQKKDS